MYQYGLKDGALKCIQKKFCVYTFFGMYIYPKNKITTFLIESLEHVMVKICMFGYFLYLIF